MTVLLLEILAAARAHVAPLAAESAGYLMLAAADQVALAPRVLDSGDVELSADGTVRLRARRDGAPASASASPELGLRELLARSLEVASSVGPALRRAAERRQEAGLDALVRELETALIPVNRAAAKRALSRLYRETERARDAGKLTALLQAADLETPAPSAEAVVLAADFPQGESATPPPRLPEVVDAPAPIKAPAAVAPPPPAVALASAQPVVAPAQPVVAPAQPVVAPAPMFLSPPPLPTEELAVTKPEPVVERARERGTTTPRLGTVVTAQTLPGEDVERTERAPAVEFAVDAEELDVPIDVVLEAEQSSGKASAAPLAARAPQPLVDPEPSSLPDVLSAMRSLHLDVAAIEAEEAPTRIRDVVTELRAVEAEPACSPLPVLVEPSVPEALIWNPDPELVDPSVHEALTWNPGAVDLVAPLPPSALAIFEAAPEPSPYAPAVLPARISDVSELLDTFYVSGGSEERELRGALKEMAGLELTPMPHPLVLGKQG